MEKSRVIYCTEDSMGNAYPYDAFESARHIMNVSLPENIIIIADLGLWDGRHPAYGSCGANLADVLYVGCGDYRKWYLDSLGDVRCEDAHHDGTNYYLFRMWKSGISESRKQNFMDAIKNGTVTRKDITRCTVRLGAYVADLCGWAIRGRKAI